MAAIPEELISSDYRALQVEMHRDVSYGIGAYRHAAAIAEVIIERGIASLLDYGCGKGTLKRTLERDYGVSEVREYDPGIAGKDAEPMPAELVVCTDVLEHIEPDKLDAVLGHLRALSLRYAVLVISTVPAIKSLPDGRNAHINLHDAGWWAEKLGVYFNIKSMEIVGNGILVFAEPYLLIGEILSKGVLSDEERLAHVRQNVLVTARRLGIRKAHNGVCILLCYGPSLSDTYRSALDEYHLIRGQGEEVALVSVSGSHDWLVAKGIVPTHHVECDPRLHKGEMTRRLKDATTYLYASCCHPEVVARLAGKDNLVLWHLDNGNDEFSPRQVEPNSVTVEGGGSVGLRAVSLFAAMGYRRFIIHGMDCSYRDDGATHAGEHSGKKPQLISVVSYGRKFVASPVMLTYLKQFDQLRMTFTPPNGDLEIILRGDGLLQHSVISTPGAAQFGPMPFLDEQAA